LAPVSRLSAWAGALSTGLWLPLAFRRVAFASGAIPLPLWGWAGLAAGLLPRAGQTATGLPRSAPGSCEGGGCLVYSGAWVSCRKKARVFLPVGPLLPSGLTIVPATQDDGASSQVNSRSPVPSFPRPVGPDGSGLPWACPLGSTPPRCRGGVQGWEPTWDTGRGLATTTPERPRVAPSHSCSVMRSSSGTSPAPA
jgi:hypothetical protein